MARPQSPLVGYNTNVRHRGKLYHIQTEDSGVSHPHVITHLFADGGRIIASRKTSYAQYVGSEDLPNIVRKLMQQQHKGIFIELRDCVFDEEESTPATPTEESQGQSARKANDSSTAPSSSSRPIASTANRSVSAAGRSTVTSHEGESIPTPEPSSPEIQALERAAAQKAAEAAAVRGVGRYQQHVPVRASETQSATANNESIFGGGLLRGKSLDEVILSYLADDLSDNSER